MPYNNFRRSRGRHLPLRSILGRCGRAGEPGGRFAGARLFCSSASRASQGEGENFPFPSPGSSQKLVLDPTAPESRRSPRRQAAARAGAVSGSDVLVGRCLYLDRVGDDEIAFVGPTELQCMWFGPQQVCPQLFLFVLVLPQVFQIECLHSCFCSFRNRHENPKPRPRLTARPSAKKARAVLIAVRNELSTGPCERRPWRKKQSFPSLPPKCP